MEEDRALRRQQGKDAATIQELRHEFGSLLALVEQGEAVEITERGKPIALRSPPAWARTTRTWQGPDFAARLKWISGDLVVPGAA